MQTTPDTETSGAETSSAETPIFRELNQELGELPEIDVHDFDEHAFDFLHEQQQESAATNGAAHAQPGQLHEVQDAEDTSTEQGPRRGGRRRKPE